jgi:tetratricopeptide (TPR) repeat protein
MQLQPGEASWAFSRGLARVRKKDFKGAVEDLTTAIGLQPDNAAYYAERGLARFELGILSNATVDLDKAVALDPNSAEQRFNRSRLHRLMGNLPAAQSDLTAALKLDPRHSGAYGLRGVIREARGDLDGALADYTQAAALNREHVFHQFRRFLVLRQKHQDGFAELARAVAQTPEGWERAIGRYLIDTLPENDFLALAAKGTAETQRLQLCEAHYYVGMTYLIAGNDARAREHLQKCVDQKVLNYLEDTLARAELQRL